MGGGDTNEWELVEEPSDCCAERTNKEAIAATKVVAMNVYREHFGVVVITAAGRWGECYEEGDQEGSAGGREPNTGEEAANVGDDRGDEGGYRRMACGEDDSVDRLVFVVAAVAEGLILSLIHI